MILAKFWNNYCSIPKKTTFVLNNMSYYKYILKFDDENHTFSAENGLPLEDFLRITNALQKSIKGNFVLSSIISASYGIEFTTENPLELVGMEEIHNKISEKNISGFNKNQQNYVKELNAYLDKRPDVSVFGQNPAKQETPKLITRVEIKKTVDFYYETGSLSGIITSIGGKDIDKKSTIFISKNDYEIEVSNAQEKVLLPYFKKEKLRFYVKKKVDFNTMEVKSAVLESFEVMSSESFLKSLKEFKEKYSAELSEIQDYEEEFDKN